MANYPKELLDLLEQYLTDGVMTSKEREVLLRKAEAMNVDKDEFDLYIDAEIQKIDQKADTIKRQSKGKLCPFCEASIPTLADKCPECGANITPSATKELEEIIEKLEDALVNFKSGNNIDKSKAEVERYIRKANMYYENNTKVKKLLEEVALEKLKADSLAKKNARKKVITNILTYNKKLTVGVAIAFVVLVLSVVYGIFSEDYSDSPQETIDAMNKAIDDDNLDKAAKYFFAYREANGRSYDGDIQIAINKLAKAYIKKGLYEEANAMQGQDLHTCASKINWYLQDQFIAVGEYEMADKCIDWWGATDKHYNFICKCIDHMKETGVSDSKIKSFIKKMTVRYDSYLTHKTEWQQPAVQERLLDYAEIK